MGAHIIVAVLGLQKVFLPSASIVLKSVGDAEDGSRYEVTRAAKHPQLRAS